VKKNNLKTSEPLTQIDTKDPISESDNKADGGTNIVPKTKTITLTDQIKEFITNSKVHVSQFRLIIEDINKDTVKLVDDLWDTGITFIVSSSTDLVALNELNNKIINLSGSIGRWRVTTSADIYLEPGELFISTKELSNEQIIRLPVQQVLKCI
jgi:hypothetical protein